MMVQHNRSAGIAGPWRPGSCKLAATLIAMLLWALPTSSLAAHYTPQPTTKPTVVPVGSPPKDYWLLGKKPLRFDLTGPGELTGYARVNFAEQEEGAKNGRLVLLGVPGVPAAIDLVFEPSSVTSYGDGREGRPSGGQKFACEIPAGSHTLELRGEGSSDAPLFVILYYDGPPQASASAAESAKPKRSARPAVSWSYQFGLDIIYDSNILSNSDDYLDQWHQGIDLDAFRVRTKDDLIISPSLEIEASQRIFSFGSTRLSSKISHWQYSNNPIKSNMEMSASLRQYVARGRSFEFTYLFAPEQYIRELSDRAPFTPQEDPSIYKGFRFTKNVLNLTYRHRINRRWSAKFLVENNLRYYNQPFIENDIDAWEGRGSVAWSFHPDWEVSADYSYEKATARAVDSVGETRETSDDSDGSYTRDLYRFEIQWEPPFLSGVIDRINVSGLLMLYWYSTRRALFDDPFHVSRKDTQSMLTIEVRRRLSRSLTADLSWRGTQRTVDSPWPGDVSLDKDFTKFRLSLGLTYRL